MTFLTCLVLTDHHHCTRGLCPHHQPFQGHGDLFYRLGKIVLHLLWGNFALFTFSFHDDTSDNKIFYFHSTSRQR